MKIPVGCQCTLTTEFQDPEIVPLDEQTRDFPIAKACFRLILPTCTGHDGDQRLDSDSSDDSFDGHDGDQRLDSDSFDSDDNDDAVSSIMLETADTVCLGTYIHKKKGDEARDGTVIFCDLRPKWCKNVNSKGMHQLCV